MGSVRRFCVVIAALVAGVACTSAAALPKPQVPGLQVALYRHGFYKGPIDGIAGPLTKQAIRDFQHDHGMRVTSELDPAMLRQLTASNKTATLE